MQVNMDNQSIQNIYDAYVGGKMSPEERAAYETDVRAGKIQTPKDLNQQTTSEPLELPKGVIDAYNSGKMDEAAKLQLEQDAAAGKIKLTKDLQLKGTQPADTGLIAGLKEAFTGEQRATPTTQALPDWGNMPEFSDPSMAGLKAELGKAFSSPEEAAKIIKVNYPNVGIGKDEKGNIILRSSLDGQSYAIKPGFQTSDIIPTVAKTLAFLPAGRVTGVLKGIAAGAGTQAAIEAGQAAIGGQIDPGQIALAGAVGGVAPALGKGNALIKEAMAQPSAAQPIVQQAPQIPLQQLAETTKKAAEGGIGSSNALTTLASQAAPNPEIVSSAERLGISQYLQPDHVTTNQVYRELAQGLKSTMGSETHKAEIEGLQKVGERANSLVDELGGTTDLSQLSHDVRVRMGTLHDEAKAKAGDLYNKVAAAIPKSTPVEAPNTLALLKEMQNNGLNLSAGERGLLKRLSDTQNPPTYAYLDQQRKLIGKGMSGLQNGPYGTTESGAAKRLYARLADDQVAIADLHNVGLDYDNAQWYTQIYKGFQDDTQAIFGKNVDKSLVQPLMSGMAGLSKGDTAGFAKLVAAVPPEMRKQVVTSGLSAAFGKQLQQGSLNFNTFANWYEGVMKNSQAKGALFANLDPAARQSLQDLYNVSNGIRLATKNYVTTGKIQEVQRIFGDADSAMSRIYKAAKVLIPTEAAGSAMGMPGFATAVNVGRAIGAGGKGDAMRAADALIGSPEFTLAIIRNQQNPGQAVNILARSEKFRNMWNVIKSDRPATTPQMWATSLLQGTINQQGSR